MSCIKIDIVPDAEPGNKEATRTSQTFSAKSVDEFPLQGGSGYGFAVVPFDVTGVGSFALNNTLMSGVLTLVLTM
jgi:hypothetical protein